MSCPAYNSKGWWFYDVDGSYQENITQKISTNGLLSHYLIRWTEVFYSIIIWVKYNHINIVNLN